MWTRIWSIPRPLREAVVILLIQKDVKSGQGGFHQTISGGRWSKFSFCAHYKAKGGAVMGFVANCRTICPVLMETSHIIVVFAHASASNLHPIMKVQFIAVIFAQRFLARPNAIWLIRSHTSEIRFFLMEAPNAKTRDVFMSMALVYV